MDQEALNADLHFALLYRHLDDVVRLVEQGADPNYLAADGPNSEAVIHETPLHMAVWKKGGDAPQRLLLLGADPNKKSSSQSTPLHIAARVSKPEHIETLLRHDASVNSVTDTLQTPLHQAVQASSVESIALLLRAGARTDAKNQYGATVDHVASKAKSQRYLDYLNLKKELGGSIVAAQMPDVLPPKQQLLSSQGDMAAFNPLNIGFWQQFGAVADTLAEQGHPIRHDDVLCEPSADGRTHLLDYASHFFAESKALQALARSGYTLKAKDLQDENGKPRPYVAAMAKAGTLGRLFSTQLWENQKPGHLQSCYRCLLEMFPDETRTQVNNYHALMAQTRSAVQAPAWLR